MFFFAKTSEHFLSMNFGREKKNCKNFLSPYHSKNVHTKTKQKNIKILASFFTHIEKRGLYNVLGYTLYNFDKIGLK